jgi:PAS domain S-box-containing protein
MNGDNKLEKIGFRMVFDLIPCGVCVATDTSCKEIIYNPAAVRFLRNQSWIGFSAANEPIVPYRVFRHGKELSPDDMPLQRAAWFGEEVVGDELELLWEDGVRRRALFSARPFRDDQGHIIAAVSVFEDITGRKQTGREEEQYRIVVENLSDLVCHSLPDTTVTFVNEAYCHVFGRVRAEIIGKRWLEFVPQAERPALQQFWNELCLRGTTENVKKVDTLISMNGNQYWIEWINRPIIDAAGSVVEIQGVGRNRTIEKRLEEELRCSEKKHRELLDGIPCLVLWTNKAGTVKFVNEFTKKFFEPWLGELRGMSLLGTIIPDGDLNIKNLSQLAGSFCRDERPLVSEYRLPNDNQVWIQWKFRHYAHPVTKASGILCVGFEITGQRHAEQALQYRYERRCRTILLNKALRGEIGGRELVEVARRSGISFAAQSLLHIIQIRGIIDGGQILMQDEHGKSYQAEGDKLIVEISLKTAGVAWHAPDGIAVLIPLSDQQDASARKQKSNAAEILLSLVRRAFPERQAVIGAAAVTGNPPDMAMAYQQAMFALRVGRSMKRGTPVHYWQDLGMLQLMSSCWDSDLSKAFVQAELGKLLMYDKQKGSFLMDTLEAILTADSVVSIAKQLHVHEKTVLFRKRKIEHILGANIDHQDKRLNLLTAIKLFRLMQAGGKK